MTLAWIFGVFLKSKQGAAISTSVRARYPNYNPQFICMKTSELTKKQPTKLKTKEKQKTIDVLSN